MGKILGETNFQSWEFLRSGWKAEGIKRKKKKETKKSVKTMASFASSATTGGARKHAWTKILGFVPYSYWKYHHYFIKPDKNHSNYILFYFNSNHISYFFSIGFQIDCNQSWYLNSLDSFDYYVLVILNINKA